MGRKYGGYSSAAPRFLRSPYGRTPPVKKGEVWAVMGQWRNGGEQCGISTIGRGGNTVIHRGLRCLGDRCSFDAEGVILRLLESVSEIWNQLV